MAFFLGILALTLFTQGADPGQSLPLTTVTTTDRFALQNDARVTLHHFLIAWATAEAGEWPRFALPLGERDDWESVLDNHGRDIWLAAVTSYSAAVGRSLVFDTNLATLRDWAAGAADVAAVPASERPMAEALMAALPIYQRHWWTAHQQSNQRWIEAVVPLLDTIEDQMIARFEAAYGGRWPKAQIPIDIVVYANDVGAYSTGGRLTLSGAQRGNQMPQALEMVFHEASHTDEMEQPLRAAIDLAYRARGGQAPDRFWHDVIFYTAGEITRLTLAALGEPEYHHYGSFGVYRRGERWHKELPALQAIWRPLLESQSPDDGARRAALEALAAALWPEVRERSRRWQAFFLGCGVAGRVLRPESHEQVARSRGHDDAKPGPSRNAYLRSEEGRS
jgi:hypothetical protein